VFAGLDWVGICQPIGSFETTYEKGATMTVTTNAPEPTDRRCDLNELQTGSSSCVIDFFTARDQMIADSNSSTEPFGYRHEIRSIAFRRAYSYPLSDPLEDWLSSLISGAALVSLLIAILCFPSFTATKTDLSKPQPFSHAESFLVTQNQG
jgi:hypothetical protein